MILNGVKCDFCKDIIYSRAGHDMHWCSCGKTFVDGGLNYLRWGGQGQPVTIDLGYTLSEEDLYNDWAEGIDDYGYIAEEDAWRYQIDKNS